MSELRNNRGVTLLSVMVAAVILAIALSMAASAFISSSKLTKQAADLTQASNFAEGVMERVKSQPYETLKTTQVTSGLPKLPRAECSVQVKPFGEGLRQVTVTCSWVDDNRARRTSLSTLVAKGGSR